MVDLIIVAVVLVIVGTAAVYIIRARKSGVKCIGCPSGSSCSGSCGSCSAGSEENTTCNCGCHTDTNV